VHEVWVRELRPVIQAMAGCAALSLPTVFGAVVCWATLRSMCGLEADSKAQRAGDFEHCCETRIAFAGKGLIEAFSRHACIACELADVACAGDVSECRRDQGWVSIFGAGVQVCRDVLFGFEVFGGVVATEGFFRHDSLLRSEVTADALPAMSIRRIRVGSVVIPRGLQKAARH